MMEKNSTGIHSENQQKVWTLESNSAVNRSTIERDVSKLLDALDTDKRIDKSTYSVATYNNWLYIDGTKQSPEVNNKYRKYFDRKGDFVTKQSYQ